MISKLLIISEQISLQLTKTMASNDETPEPPQRDYASETLTYKARKRDQMVSNNQLTLL